METNGSRGMSTAQAEEHDRETQIGTTTRRDFLCYIPQVNGRIELSNTVQVKSHDHVSGSRSQKGHIVDDDDEQELTIPQWRITRN